MRTTMEFVFSRNEQTTTGQIRACVPEDMPRVADLFQTIFRGLSRPAPSSLQQYLLELFFKSPSHDLELPSLVYVRPTKRSVVS